MPATTYYRRRIETLQETHSRLMRRSTTVSRSRGVTFLTAAGLALYAWAESAPPAPLYVAAGTVFAGFVALVGYHEFLLDQLQVTTTRIDISQHQLARIGRDWVDVPAIRIGVPHEYAQRAADLDLFGSASLFQLLCNASTPFGISILRDWLLQVVSRDEIAIRQEAVRWLIDKRQFREELALRGRLLAASDADPAGLLAWAEGDPWLDKRRWLKVIVPGLSLAVITLIVLIVGQLIAAEWILLIFGLVGVNIIVNVIYLGPLHDLFNQITSGRNEVVHYAALFRAVANLPDEPAVLGQLKKRMSPTAVSFHQALARLRRINKLGSGRKSALFGVPYFFTQILFLWDFHIFAWLERWRRRFGASIRAWLDAVGRLEALASLATLAHDHPAWVFPEVFSRHEAKIEAKALGHPLIRDTDCVRNDVAVGPPGTFLLVTGSNMSGKSTLLRALGVNATLAQAGGPVCAAALRLPLVQIETSMRVRDSLADGVSYFMAELLRLKQIVDVSRETSVQDDVVLLYLLDEILQGTNSAERHIAVAEVIGHLIDRRAIGAVSTHDLQLATAEKLRTHCQTVHFRESIRGTGADRNMTFDYQLRAGIAPTTNALKLLELVGLRDAAP